MQNQRQASIAPASRCLFLTSLSAFFWLGAFLQQDVPLFSADGSLFYTILPAKQGARGEFRHIASLSAQVSFRAVKFYSFVSHPWITEDSGCKHFNDVCDSRSVFSPQSPPSLSSEKQFILFSPKLQLPKHHLKYGSCFTATYSCWVVKSHTFGLM